MGAGPTGNVAGQDGEEGGRAADYPEAALVPGKGCASPCPHIAWAEPTLTIGHADRAVDDFAGVVMDRDGDLVGGH